MSVLVNASPSARPIHILSDDSGVKGDHENVSLPVTHVCKGDVYRCAGQGFRRCVFGEWTDVQPCGPGTYCRPLGSTSIVCDYPRHRHTIITPQRKHHLKVPPENNQTSDEDPNTITVTSPNNKSKPLTNIGANSQPNANTNTETKTGSQVSNGGTITGIKANTTDNDVSSMPDNDVAKHTVAKSVEDQVKVPVLDNTATLAQQTNGVDSGNTLVDNVSDPTCQSPEIKKTTDVNHKSTDAHDNTTISKKSDAPSSPSTSPSVKPDQSSKNGQSDVSISYGKMDNAWNDPGLHQPNTAVVPPPSNTNATLCAVNNVINSKDGLPCIIQPVSTDNNAKAVETPVSAAKSNPDGPWPDRLKKTLDHPESSTLS